MGPLTGELSGLCGSESTWSQTASDRANSARN